MQAIETCALTPLQMKEWDKTRTALLWHQPAFSHVMYTMMDPVLFTKAVPIAATDGGNLMLNPDTFFAFPLAQRIFIVVHEIMHCILNHLILAHAFQRRGKISYPDGKTIPYHHPLMNVATDYVINALLVESKIGEMPTEGGKKDGGQVGLYDPKMATGMDSAIDVYRKVYKDTPKCYVSMCGADGEGQGGGKAGQGFDKHMAPGAAKGKDPTTAAQERSDSEWATQVQAGMNAAKAQGKLPGGIERLFKEILDPVVDWKDKIIGIFARKVGSGSNDWRRANRRLIVRDMYAPGRSGFGAGCVVIGVDTSGSIGQRELDMFFAEMSGILDDVQPKRLVIMWCDAAVHRVDEAEEPSDLMDLRQKKAPGGGGTDFRPVFDEITKLGLEPDALVYLTDGLGTFPDKEPEYPVIWGSIYESSKYPFGDVVNVPKQAA